MTHQPTHTYFNSSPPLPPPPPPSSKTTLLTMYNTISLFNGAESHANKYLFNYTKSNKQNHSLHTINCTPTILTLSRDFTLLNVMRLELSPSILNVFEVSCLSGSGASTSMISPLEQKINKLFLSCDWENIHWHKWQNSRKLYFFILLRKFSYHI